MDVCGSVIFLEALFAMSVTFSRAAFQVKVASATPTHFCLLLTVPSFFCQGVLLEFRLSESCLGLQYSWRPLCDLRGSVDGWGAMLQDGRSRVRVPIRSLILSIYVILPAATWPCSLLSLYQKLVPEDFLRVKARPASTADLTAICEPID
jgi:hypothetical protein